MQGSEGQGGPAGPSGPDPGKLQELDGQATTSLILGILGLVLCAILAPFALTKGKKVNDQLKAMGAQPNGKATAGFIMGIIGTIGIIVWLLIVVMMVVGGAAAAAGGATG